MPIVAKDLSAVEVKRIIQHGFHFVGGVAGLMLQVSASGSRSWILRVRIGEKRRDIGLGSCSEVSLAKAREIALQKKSLIKQGIDPIEERKQAKAKLIASQRNTITFDEAAVKTHEKLSNEFTNEKYTKQWISIVKTYASPIIGKMPVSEISLHEIKLVLTPIWNEKTDTAKKLRGNIESILSWARIHEYRQGENPARWKGYLDQVFAKPSKIQIEKHQPALPYKEISLFVDKLKSKPGLAARMLEFAILTGGRSNEVMGARWEEFELEEKLWTVPKERMGKTNKEHRVALSSEAVELIKSLPRFENVDFVFPTPRDKNMSMSNNAMLKVCIDMHNSEINAGFKGWIDPKENNRRIVPHGFRSTFRDWASEVSNHSHEVKEIALAHTIDSSTEAAYRRGDLFQKRVALVQDWADYIYQTSQK